jgi:hypothetical protein
MMKTSEQHCGLTFRIQSCESSIEGFQASCMHFLRQCVHALFQPVDLPLNLFEPFALVDLPPLLEAANRVRLNARDMLVASMLHRGHSGVQIARRIFHTVQKHDADNY